MNVIQKVVGKMSDERLMELRDALYLGLDNYYPNMIGELMEAVTGLKAENKQLKEKLNKYLDENAFNLIKDIKNIESIIINFKNGTSIPFILNSNNNFQTFKDKNDLCIIQSEYNIKYYEIGSMVHDDKDEERKRTEEEQDFCQVCEAEVRVESCEL